MKQLTSRKRFSLIGLGLFWLIWFSACGGTPPPPQRTMPRTSAQPEDVEAPAPSETDAVAGTVAETDMDEETDMDAETEGMTAEDPEDVTGEASEDIQAPVPPQIRYFIGDEEFSLEELQDGDFPDDTTVKISAHRHTPHGEVTEALINIHTLGYAVEFVVKDSRE